MIEWLGELAAEVSWPATENPIPDGEIARIYDHTQNIHKFLHYLPVYEEKFRPYRDRPIAMLEIGVAGGGSAEMWREYFCPEATIVGIDGDRKCARFDDPPRKKFVRVGRQEDVAFLRSVVEEFGPFDVIIDDASHLPSYTLKTFRYLFLNGLANDGVYLVEDLMWCYMSIGQEPFTQVPDANDGTPTFTEITKGLIDVLHEHYTRGPHETSAYTPGDHLRPAAITVPLATMLMSRIDVHDGIVAIHRAARDMPRLIHKYDPEFLREWLRE